MPLQPKDTLLQFRTEVGDSTEAALLVAALKAGLDRETLLDCNAEHLEQKLILLSLMAMMDPPRPEVEEAIARCHQVGIALTMITGDYGKTAAAIASSSGLVQGKPRVVTEQELEHLSDAQLRQVSYRWKGLIFARVMPEQKLRIVQAYKSMGETGR